MRPRFEKRWAGWPGIALLGCLALAAFWPQAGSAAGARGVAQPKPSRSQACPKRNQEKRRARRCAKPVRPTRPPLATSPLPLAAAPAIAPSSPAVPGSPHVAPPDTVTVAPESPLPPAPPEPPSEPPEPPSVPPEPPVVPPEPPVAARIFALDSVWTTPLPAAAPLDVDSPGLVAALVAKIAAEVEAGAPPRLGGDSRAALYRVGPEQPRVPVYLDTGSWGDRLADRFRAGVPIPADALPVSGSDHSMAVWQPSTDTYWEFFKMQQALHAPQPVRGPSVNAGCALPAGDYIYVVTSLNANGETAADVKGVGAEVEADGGCVTVRWAPIAGASGYRLYRGPSRDQVSELATVTAPAVSFRDEGLVEPGGNVPPSTNTATTPGEWHAAYGGLIADVSESPGYFRDRLGPTGDVLEQSNWGSAASGLPLLGGLITKEDVERGSIDHAVAIGLDNSGADAILRSGQFAFPAQRTDGRSSRPDSIPEGARLVLDPGLDLDSLELSPLSRMIAEAAQRYGLVVEDGSLSTLIYAEDPAPDMRAGLPNFYRPLVGSSSPRALRSFPWQDLEVAAMRLCTVRPCLPG